MKKIHYAWLVCIGCALMFFCTSGLAVNAFTVYQPFIISVNNFTNTQSSTLIACRSLSSLITMFFVGIYYKKLNIRPGMAISGMMLVLAFILYGSATDFIGYCIASVAAGISYASGAVIPITILISRWFVGKRDTAMGICTAVTGLSTLGIPSIITKSINTFGLRNTFYAEAAVIALCVTMCFILVRSCPADMEISPYGAEDIEQAGSDVSAKTADSGHDMTVFELVGMIVILVLIGAAMNVSYSHLTVLITSEGLSSEKAAIAMSVSGISLMVGKIVCGRLGDKLGVIKCNFILGPVFILGMTMFCFIGKIPALMYPAMVLYSFGLAFIALGISTWASELSTKKKHDGLVQIFQIGYAAGSLIFSPLPGIMADKFDGSYIPAYRLFILISFVVFAGVQAILILHGKKAIKNK